MKAANLFLYRVPELNNRLLSTECLVAINLAVWERETKIRFGYCSVLS